MEKDLEKELEELLGKHKSKEEFKGIGIAPCMDTGCGDWVTMLLALMMLGDKPIVEQKQPIINIYLGGDEYMGRMYDEYGRYMESRERYGAGKESDEAFHFMTESLKEFTKYLFEIAETPQQKQMLKEALQSPMM